jgi:hypothetical protein
VGASDRAITSLFYVSLVGSVAAAPAAPVGWVMPDLGQWGLLALMGFFATAGHFMLIQAHRLAPAPVLAPFIYTQIIWMTLIGFVMFGDVPDAMTIPGAPGGCQRALCALPGAEGSGCPRETVDADRLHRRRAHGPWHGMVNLLRAGHDVAVVAHRNPATRRGPGAARRPQGGKPRRTGKASRNHRHLRANSNAVQEVVAALKPHLAAGQIILDMGTSDPAVNRRLAAELAPKASHLPKHR